MTVEEYKQIAEVNLWGTVRMTKAFLPLLKREKGRVVNISSVAGMVPLQRSSAYCISKFGVSVFSDALRREMSPWGVGVVLVEPGAFKTQATDPKATKENIKGFWDRLDPTTREEYGQDHFLSVCTMLDYHLSKSSTSLESVSHVVHDALTSRDPKTRYQVGVDACLFRLVAALPTVISDFVLSKLIERVEIPPQGC
ncbi:D-beta-hydroxybutyrate dehydrogenase, mitochondrial [Nematostella vectensis]|uniref:D-beta-hydroxybutyrate dehydrogenase, mitochondrial n=1 Tax=Nematostella vectensis TaxID=45351 RepID=UPI002076FD32|nr:D-beta-hydroxybutyrate dehydrogenase, mitochondrial [Nematostella vectensis]